MFEIKNGECLEELKKLPDESVNCVITSPPYYGLRDYGTATWVGGDPNCNHYRETKKSEKTATGHKAMAELGNAVGDAIYKTVCPKCGAIRIDNQIGLEETPEQYIERLVNVFREIRRVLKDDGTVWLNIGDTYNASSYRKDENSSGHGKQGSNKGGYENVVERPTDRNCKPKDLIGIPWMLAFALRNDGWYLRQDIIWAKKNPMPEPVTDRCTKSHEYIFLLSKSSKYYFDSDAMKEPATTSENRPSGVARERELNYNSKRNLHPEAYLTSKYDNKEEESSYRQCMHKDRGNGIILKRYNLPDKDVFINFIKSANKTEELMELGISKTTVEHWVRRDEYFSYPSIEDWNTCKHLFTSIENFEYIDKCLSDITEETDAIGKRHTGIKFGGNKYSESEETNGNRRYSGKEYIDTGYRNKRDVWFIGTKPYKGAHFATFPEELITPCVLAGCPEGGTVLDPFSGSGTTGVVSLHNKRNYVGIELNEKYVEMSINRIKEECAKKVLW